jgi:putative DNA primase/helicase
VILVEGEKDADTVASMGLPGTTFAQGAGNVTEFDGYGQWFQGKRLVILPDNDEKGRYHAELCAWLFRDVATEIRIIPLSSAEKGDVTDWVEREGGSKDKLLMAIMSARAVEKKGLKKPERPKDSKTAAVAPEKRSASKKGRPEADYLAMAQDFHAANLVAGYIRYRSYHGAWYRYAGAYYQHITEDTMKSAIITWLQDVLPGHANVNARNNALANLLSWNMCALQEWWPMPCWIDRDGAPADGWMATGNKLVNLRSAALQILGRSIPDDQVIREPTPALFSAFAVPYQFNPAAKCPKWDAYLSRVQPDEWDRRVLAMMAGLALIPDTSYNVCFFLFGSPGSGKSVFLYVLAHLVGVANICCVPLKDFNQRFSTWPLTQKLLNIVGELPVDDGRRGGVDMATVEGMLKDCTSGGLVPVEMKGQDRYEAPVIARCVFAMNELPRFFDRSDGLWDRLRIISFDQRVRGTAEDNPHLRSEIVEAELPGVLNWALCGLADLLQVKQFPESTRGSQLKKDHRDFCDPEGSYLTEHYQRNDDSVLRCSEMYEHYSTWAKESGYYARSNATFNKAVERVFGTRKRSLRDSMGRVAKGFKGVERRPESITAKELSDRAEARSVLGDAMAVEVLE